MLNNNKEVLIPDHDRILPKIKKPNESIFLEWSNINYTIKLDVKDKKVGTDKVSHIIVDPEDLSQKSEDYDDHNTKTILRNINGFAMPGELLAIMGPSGCGKTSLLNIIADRQLPGQKNHEIIRDVKANNIIIDQSNFGKICAYIMQEDILMDCLSPRESLIFGARLRLKSSNEEILNRVERLLKQVKFLFNK